MIFTGEDSVFECQFYNSSGVLGDWVRVGQLTDFTVDHSVEKVELKELGTSGVKSIPTYTNWTVTINGSLDYATAGHSSFKLGARAEMVIMPEGYENDKLRVAGTVYVQDVSYTSIAGDIAKFSATLTGDGDVYIDGGWRKYTPINPATGLPYVTDYDGGYYPPGAVVDPATEKLAILTNPPFSHYLDWQALTSGDPTSSAAWFQLNWDVDRPFKLFTPYTLTQNSSSVWSISLNEATSSPDVPEYPDDVFVNEDDQTEPLAVDNTRLEAIFAHENP